MTTPPAPAAGDNRTVRGIHYEWTVHRTLNEFRVRIVEPAPVDPARHIEIFGDVLTRSLMPLDIDIKVSEAEQRLARPRDLTVFPEAFLPQDDLVAALEVLPAQGSFGAVHVGLRPDLQSSHLFSFAQVTSLIERLSALPAAVPADFEGLRAWLRRHHATDCFNLSCFFTLDIDRNLRISIQVKNLASPTMEQGFLPETNATEGDLLTVVTLHPDDKSFRTVVIQPIICSDCLDLQMKNGGAAPVRAITSSAERLGERPPDYVDIVSVATYTQQSIQGDDRIGWTPAWKMRFREVFERAIGSAAYGRHNFAIFALANFYEVENRVAGLSGYFCPTPFQGGVKLDSTLRAWTWGRQPNADLDWRPIDPVGEDAVTREHQGQLVCIDSDRPPGAALARVLDYTINQFPRHGPRFNPAPMIINCAVIDLPDRHNQDGSSTPPITEPGDE